MIPRIHKRGSSFKEALNYVLHDPGSQTAHRLDWAFSANCGTVDVADSWRPMYETWDRRTALKRENGVDLRGADNKTPVMHYTLSWAPDDRPSKQQMMDAALQSLKALGLGDHQAAIAAHNDTAHPHVHIVVNTVHPTTGRTAPLKFPARTLRDFASEHDRQRGVYNAEREAAANRTRPPPRNGKLREESMAMLRPNPMLDKIRPERPEPHHRRRALEKRDVINRMRRHRAENDRLHLVEKDALWTVHRGERDELYRRSKEACQVARAYVKDRFKGRWRDLYEAQRIEWKHVERIQGNPLERAVYVVVNSERLANGQGLSMKRKAELIASPTKLFKAVESLHARERGSLAQVEKAELKERFDRVWKNHEFSFARMAARQVAERESVRKAQQAENDRDITWYRASEELTAERRGEVPERMADGAMPFETDAMYVARIKAEKAAFYKRHCGEDSVPFLPWENEKPSTNSNSSPLQRGDRANENDFDNEM